MCVMKVEASKVTRPWVEVEEHIRADGSKRLGRSYWSAIVFETDHYKDDVVGKHGMLIVTDTATGESWTMGEVRVMMHPEKPSSYIATFLTIVYASPLQSAA